jgi:hypothetical protein
MTDRLRVLHCPTEVGGNPTGLSRAERSLGAESRVAVIRRSPRHYDVDIDLDLGRRGRVGRLVGRAGFVARSLSRYDVFHFNFGQTLLPRLGPLGLDLPLLRAAGKRAFMTFQGCDARQTSYCRAHFALSCCGADTGGDLCRVEQDAGKRRAVRYALRHCHRCFCLNPDLLHVVPGAEFVPYASVDPAAVRPVPASPPDAARPLRILHAPTSRAIKGTEHVLRAVEALRSSHAIELMVVENLAHAEAMERYRAADVVVDQLKIGWYGGFAVELMAMGKPVIAYVREDDLGGIPARMREELPIVGATPDTLEEVLGGLLDDPARRAEVGRCSRAFVERWHDPIRIARRMLEVYASPDRPFWDETGVLPAA